ncbi:MAG: hypothetical protein K6G11_04725, partial [Lachnospiraceae bacterium]|nr:hypothetical protein [Lachnospiraceae bacterium]
LKGSATAKEFNVNAAASENEIDIDATATAREFDVNLTDTKGQPVTDSQSQNVSADSTLLTDGRKFYRINSAGGPKPYESCPYTDLDVRNTSLRAALKSANRNTNNEGISDSSPEKPTNVADDTNVKDKTGISDSSPEKPTNVADDTNIKDNAGLYDLCDKADFFEQILVGLRNLTR